MHQLSSCVYLLLLWWIFLLMIHIFTLRHRGCNKSLFLQMGLLLRLSLEKLGYYNDKGRTLERSTSFSLCTYYLLRRIFNETPVNPRKSIAVLTKILYLINQGEVLGTSEATECFFAITKLFQVFIKFYFLKSWKLWDKRQTILKFDSLAFVSKIYGELDKIVCLFSSIINKQWCYSNLFGLC